MKVGIIGFGRIGVLCAFDLMNKGYDIKCYDVAEQPSRANILDLKHAYPEKRIEFCEISRMNDCDAIVMTAGLPRKANQTRADLFKANKKIAASIANQLSEFDGSFVTITNPVDAINTVVSQILGSDRCFGFGSMIDSARLKVVTGNANDYVIGEHGENFVPIIEDKSADRNKIVEKVKHDNLYLIKNKGSTEFGPARHITTLVDNLCKRIKFNTIVSVMCSEYSTENISIGVPVSINNARVESVRKIALDDWEEQRFSKGIESVRRIISGV